MPINTTLQLTAKFTLGWIFQNTLDVGTKPPAFQDQLTYTKNFANGIGNSQSDEFWVDRRTLSPSSPSDDIDLSGTALQNAFGRDIAFVKVKGIWIVNKGRLTSGTLADGTFTPASGEDILVGATGAPANFFADLFDGDETARKPVKAGGFWGDVAPLDGYSVTGASSGDILRFLYNGAGVNDITYDIAVWGTTA